MPEFPKRIEGSLLIKINNQGVMGIENSLSLKRVYLPDQSSF